ncbi:membrane-spanning 4-domains subfamily A member 12-like [Python bivittatus]|uniref:Membrane-spanning 4-domains subfamily A member 12-like n=1 Tax=Python bivittatus TaxID=176946 RepID=A0A9F3QSY8_PYTBI|nr:membrane-spanning 4-domains subfamily A member 12-like [Python bivittatus]
MASGTFNGAIVIQTAQGIPSTVVQSSGAIPHPPYGGQQVGISNTGPQQVPKRGALEKFLYVEAKVLGAIQIMIGLIHVGFGAVLLSLFNDYPALSAAGGYPFWGGIFFISTGSVCITAEKYRSRHLVKCTVGMNITSAIMALTGVLLYFSELIINAYSNRKYEIKNVGTGLSSMLLLFSLLEFCITVPLAHFGCRATCCTYGQPTMVFLPYQVNGNAAVATESNRPSSPPPYANMVFTKPQ